MFCCRHAANGLLSCYGLICRLQPGETWSGEMVFRSHDQYWEYPLFEQMKPSPYPGYEDEDSHANIPPGPPGIDQNIPRPESAPAGAFERSIFNPYNP